MFWTASPDSGSITRESLPVINITVSRPARTTCELSATAYIRGTLIADGSEQRTLSVFFYWADRDEPPHVHGVYQSKIAKIWIDPVRVAYAGGVRRSQLREIGRPTSENRGALLEAWNDFFDR